MFGWTDSPDNSHDCDGNHFADSDYRINFRRKKGIGGGVMIWLILSPSFWIACVICLVWGVDGPVQWLVIIPLFLIELAIRNSRGGK